MIFISLAIFIMPLIGNALHANMPTALDVKEFNERILMNADEYKKEVLLNYYTLSGDEYILREDISKNEEVAIKKIIKETGYNNFFSLFEGSILPNNWLPILFVIAAGSRIRDRGIDPGRGDAIDPAGNRRAPVTPVPVVNRPDR